MSGTGSPVIQLMQNPPVPPLSVLLPSMAILRDRNSRLGLKASSPYCRLVLHACWFKVSSHGGSWPDSMNPFLARQRLKRRSFTSVSGVLDAYNLQVKACIVYFQDVWTQIPLRTNLTEGISEHIVLLYESEALDFSIAENALIVSHPVNVCRPSSDLHRFSPRMPITFAMLRRRH